MEYSICSVSIMPMRSEPSDRSEMVSQVLFGELVEVLETEGSWSHIRVLADDYEGFVDVKQLESIDLEEFERLYKSDMYYTLEPVQIIEDKAHAQAFFILQGSVLYNLSGGKSIINGKTFSYDGRYVSSQVMKSRKNVIENALSYLNAPYLWGGKTSFGIDCSGFSQMVFRISGIGLLRDASQQATQGDIVNFISDAYPGDLAFFDNEEGRIIHVGILLGNNKIIHASGRVRIDSIDHQGIFNTELRRYTHKLRLIRSFGLR